MIARSRWRDGVASVARDRLLALLVLAHVALKVALLPTALRTPIQGDESAYNDGAATLTSTLRDLLSGHGVSTTTLTDHLIGQGWFMPGMSIVLFPLYVFDQSPSQEAIRLYMGAVTLIGFLGAVAAIGAAAGRRYAVVLLVIPGLIPMWVLYSYTSWGDLAGGLAVMFVIALLVSLWKRLDAGSSVRVRDGVLLGFLLAATLYIRSSALPLVLGLLAAAALAVLLNARGSKRRRSAVAWVAAGLMFVALLLPWSYAASRSLGGRVVTTSTVPLSMAYTFGHRDELCFGPCPPGNVWFEMARYSAEVERQTGVNQLTVQQQMSDYALRDLTTSSYVRQVRDDFGRYVFQPNGFEPAFRPHWDDPQTRVSWLAAHLTTWLYFGALALAAASIVWVRRRARVHQIVAILTSLVGAALMAQPFVHVSTARYWPVFAPLMGLAIAALFIGPDPARSSRGLWRLQVLGAACWVVAAVTLLAAAR